jgi:outer membrane lipoprotein-sorting protein
MSKGEGRRQKAPRPMPSGSCLVPFVLCLLVSSCAPKPPSLPTGTGAPFPEFASAYTQATDSCRGVKTITASMAMSGKAGSTKLRGRIDAGFAAPARARLEGIAPFGKPVFVLVADAGKGTLVLTRDDRVLRDAPPEQIVEALAGVALTPDDLRTVISGCGFTTAQPSSGALVNQNQQAWLVLVFPEGHTYLARRNDTWRVAAATRGPITVTYTNGDSGRPEVVDIRATSQGHITADIHLRLSDVETNTTLDPRTFEVDLPEHPVPLTLDELRRAGPMGGN